MRDWPWSPREKSIARKAFDAAYTRECETIRREVDSILNAGSGPQVIWRLHDYLQERRREVDAKYDFRYSVLLLVFARLLTEGWLAEEDLSELAADKLEFIRRFRGL